MGLDITAYKNLKKVENPKFDKDGELENEAFEWFPGEDMKYSESYVPGRAKGIDLDTVYTWEDQLWFKAGTYTYYNWWRDMLEKFSNGSAFQELINFPDELGVIGYIVSEKLYKDFKENEKRAEEYSKSIPDNGEYWFEMYKYWEKAFEYAKEHGAVHFH